MVAKNNDNTQFSRVSNANGTSPLGASPINDALAPLVDSHGRLIITPYVGGGLVSGALTRVDSAAIVQWQLVSAAACKLFQAFGSQVTGALLWVHFFNIAAGPPAGAPFVAPIPCNDQGVWSVNFPDGLDFSTGLVIGYSTAHQPYALPAVGGWITGLIR